MPDHLGFEEVVFFAENIEFVHHLLVDFGVNAGGCLGLEVVLEVLQWLKLDYFIDLFQELIKRLRFFKFLLDSQTGAQDGEDCFEEQRDLFLLALGVEQLLAHRLLIIIQKCHQLLVVFF